MNLNHIISCRVYCFAYPRLVQRRFVSVPSRVNLKYVVYIPIGYYSTAIIVCKFLRLIQICPFNLRPQARLLLNSTYPSRKRRIRVCAAGLSSSVTAAAARIRPVKAVETSAFSIVRRMKT